MHSHSVVFLPLLGLLYSILYYSYLRYVCLQAEHSYIFWNPSSKHGILMLKVVNNDTNFCTSQLCLTVAITLYSLGSILYREAPEFCNGQCVFLELTAISFPSLSIHSMDKTFCYVL